MRTFRTPAIALAFVTCAAIAQQPATGPTGPAKPAAQPAPAPQGAESDAVKAKRERLLAASKLPKHAQEARTEGVSESDMKEAMNAAKSKGVPAHEMSDVTAEHCKAVKEHGPIDNFGAFVRGKLDQGLRGRDLAAAIREEHMKRGKGKGHKNDEKGDKPDEKGKKPDDDKGGKPDDKGKKQDDDKGKKPDDKDGKEKGPPAGKGKGKGG